MNGQRKVYVIDPVQPRAAGDGSVPKSRRPAQAGGQAGKARPEEPRSGVTLILSYLAGPAAVLASRSGRKRRLAAGLAAFSLVALAAMVPVWRRQEIWASADDPAGLVALIAAALALVAGTVAWSGAVLRAGRSEAQRLLRTPGWMRGGAAAGLFGMICPGMGLFAAGRSKHAAAALWSACLTMISLLVLYRAPWLWEFNNNAGAMAVDSARLEYLFIAAAVVAATGLAGWIVQALNGVRYATGGAGRGASAGRDWAAVALLVSIIAFSAFSRPDMIAGALDRGAQAAESKGMQVIPLQLSLTAARLDPSRPGYMIRAIEACEAAGRDADAERMRVELAAKLESSVGFLEEEGLVAGIAGDEGGRAEPGADADPIPDIYGEPPLELLPAGLAGPGWGI